MIPKQAIGIDVGATKIAGALVNIEGEIIAESQTLTQVQDGEPAVISRIVQIIETLLSQSDENICGIGIGTPGEHDPDRGVVNYAVNLNWVDVPLRERVQSRLKDKNIPVWTQNDTNVEALGEYYFGNGQGSSNFVYLGIGSGIGSGIILNGKILNGASINAGEIGHLSLAPENGRRCECGLKGCVETVVSGVGILKVTKEYLRLGIYPSNLKNNPELSTKEIIEAAQAGDPLASQVFREASSWLGFVFAIFAATINPSKIIIGGGLGHAAYDLLIPGALHELKNRVLPSPQKNLEIQLSALQSSAVGASCLVWTNINQNILSGGEKFTNNSAK